MYTLYHIVRLFLVCTALLLIQERAANAQEYEIEQAPFNSAHSDFGAVRFKDGVVFCSNRTKKKLSFDEDSINFYTDMFYARLRANNTWSNPEIFSPELTDFLNEGPATFNSSGTRILYTTNFLRERPSKRERVDEYVLGIQGAELVDGVWVKRDLFPFNAPKTDYNVAHPCIAQNDSVLYFASNMPGGQGGMDLYKCYWRNGRWSQPINLGASVNSKGDELFPFAAADGMLYFSTNGYTDRGKKNMDIYVCEIRRDGYSEPYPLPYPMNTEYDDFAYAEYTGPEYGMISSNRNEGRDMVSTFRMNTPNFVNCLENQRTVLCYTIEDIRISPIDTLPLVYEWELGDGNSARGLSVEHCYEKPGTYQIALNVIDTISNARFFGVSEAQLVIPDIQQPFILSSDTVLVDQPMKLFADLSSIGKFQVDRHYWIIDHKKTFTGDTLPYSFTTPGYHSVVCGVVGRDHKTGARMKSCSFKEIFVMNDTLPGFPKDDPNPSERPVLKIRMKETFDPFVVYRPAELAPTYHIVLAESRTRLTFNDPIFERHRLEVSETRDGQGNYVYAMCQSKDLSTLLPVFQELQDKGFREARVEVFNEPVLDGVDWKSLRKQEMVPSSQVSSSDLAYLRAIEKTEQLSDAAPEAPSASSISENLQLTGTSPADNPANPGHDAREQASSQGAEQHQQTASDPAEVPSQDRQTAFTSPAGRSTAVQNTAATSAQMDTSGTEAGMDRNATAVNGDTQPAQIATSTAESVAAHGRSADNQQDDAGQHMAAAPDGPALPAQGNASGFPGEDALTVTSSESPAAQSLPAAEAASAPVHHGSQEGSAERSFAAAAAGSGREELSATQEEPAQQTEAPHSVQVADIRGTTAERTAGSGNARTGISDPGTTVKSISVIGQELFHVIIIESPERIPMNDPFFSRIRHEIIEIEGMPSGFTYCTGISKIADELEPLVGELQGLGYAQAKIRSFNSEELARHIVRKGTYIAPGSAEKLNVEFSRLRDIKFEYNSAVILEESKKNLDYIAAMLMLEEDFELKISAHTCPIGGHDFNMNLSELRAKSVLDYFAARGISRDRMHSRGFASTQPVADNSTEQGRRQNRRVEFTIVFHTGK
jgi:outer membrane protein OmpA-like peptidoglycan-associated protein